MNKSNVEEAMEELGVSDNARPDQKLRAVCQWILGDPDWAQDIFHWLNECGYRVESPSLDNPNNIE